MEYHRDLSRNLLCFFVSDAEESAGLAFVKFVDDPILRGAADAVQNWAAVQRDLGRLKEHASRSFLKSMRTNTTESQDH